MALTLFTEAKLKSRKGFSYSVGVGNGADIRFHEYLEFFRKKTDTKSAPILDGVRGSAPYEKKALVQLLQTVSDIVMAYP